MTKHYLAVQPACPPVSLRDGDAPGRTRRRYRWARPLALQVAGLTAEALAVLALGYGALAVTGLNGASFPAPTVVALLYVALLVLHGGVLQPRGEAKTGLAVRVLACVFICVAAAAAHTIFHPTGSLTILHS